MAASSLPSNAPVVSPTIPSAAPLYWTRIRELRPAALLTLPQLSFIDSLAGRRYSRLCRPWHGRSRHRRSESHLRRRRRRGIDPARFGYCSLVIAVLRDSPYQSLEDIRNVKIATSYPGSARRFFNGHGCEPEIITLSGSVEVAPSLGLADAIVELTATGSTLLLNDLRPIATILESQAVLVANPEALADPVRRENIDRILMRIKAARGPALQVRHDERARIGAARHSQSRARSQITDDRAIG